MQKPLLSIGIIFKNEIRCLERCLQSLQPLREAISCEVVMADTGSDDGSREIAEKYADILIDFPWINDFAAARNAVMEKCCGTWYFSIDCDEWLGKNIEQLTDFLIHNVTEHNYAAVLIRNYKTPELEHGGIYSDFAASRLVNRKTGVHYEGKIHEHWVGRPGDTQDVLLLDQIILHHDGYLRQEKNQTDEKFERNMALLKEALERNPEDLLLLLQCVESAAGNTDDYDTYVRRAVQGVKEKRPCWNIYGPPILRHAVLAATTKKLPEIDEWIQMAEEWFPTSLFTRLDIQYLAMGRSFDQKDYQDCIRRGNAYFQAVNDYESGNYEKGDIFCSTVAMMSRYWVQSAQIFVSSAYLMVQAPGKSRKLLHDLDASIMDLKQVKDTARNFCHLHSRSTLNTAPELLSFWRSVTAPEPSKEKAEERRKEFLRLAMDVFHPDYRAGEMKEEDYRRHAYTVFLPLLGQENCELGTAAAILETEDRAELAKLLGMVEKWDEFPIHALEHALLEGARFPVPRKPLKIEEMDALAGRMARPNGPLAGLAVLAADEELSDWQSLAWARGLALAAVRSCDWEGTERGMELCRAFAKIENTFLTKYYAAELFSDENIHILPPMHRFGWYCGKAFWALDAGDSAEYVRLLRKGLEACPEAKPMVEFLLRQLEESQKVQATPELLVLAEQVRTLLAQYPADDPAVEALKQSAAYQKVAHLIEGPELDMFGGLRQ